MKKFISTPNFFLRNFKQTVQTFLLVSCLFLFGEMRSQTPTSTWYYNGTGAINDVASWGTNPDGTGGSLANFTSGGRYFIIQNTTAVSLTGSWNVGNGSLGNAGGDSIIIGNHTTPVAPITFTLLSGSALVVSPARTIAVAVPTSSTNKIVYQNSTALSFGTIADPNLELVFDNTTITTSSSSTYGNVSVINNANVNMGGASLVLRNLTVESGSTLSGPIGASSNYIGVRSGGVVTINGTFRAGRTGGLATISAAPFPTTATSSGSLLYQDATIIQGTNLILGANSTIDFNRGTSGQTGAQTINGLNYANLNLSNSAIASNKTFPTTGTINVTGIMAINLIGASTVATPGASFAINIQPIGTFAINSVTAFGTVAGNQRITFRSDATGTASIGPMATGSSFFGSINVEKFIPGGFRKYRFLSHPFSASQPLSEITGEIDVTGNTAGTTGLGGQIVGTGFTATATNNPSAYYYNTATADGASPNDAGWLAFIDNTTSANWPRGRGIRVLVRGTKGQASTLDGTDATPNAITLTLNGNTNVGAVAVPMVNTATGLNLMGNPYASAVDIGAVLTAATPGTNIGNAFYLRNPQTESFITVSPIPASYIIPAFSAFFVQALTASNLNFTESNKSTCVSCPTVFRTTNTGNRLELKAYKDGLEYDNVVFNMDASYNNKYDKTNDAIKLMNNGFSIYSITEDNIKLAANSHNLSKNTIIPLGISLPKNSSTQTYQLKVADFAFVNNNKVLLHDKLMNKFVLLQKNKEYNLNIDPSNNKSIGDNRLELIIEN